MTWFFEPDEAAWSSGAISGLDDVKVFRVGNNCVALRRVFVISAARAQRLEKCRPHRDGRCPA